MAFWKAKTKDGQECSELDGTKWVKIEKDVVELGMSTNDGRFIFLPKNMKKYIQAKTASANLGQGENNIQIESRYIGFSLGNNIVRIRVDEKTNNISVEIE